MSAEPENADIPHDRGHRVLIPPYVPSPVSVTARVPGQAAIAAWLFAVAVMIFAMIVIGGLTRLTESGLSIVDWKPLTGWLPPFGEAAWQEVFARYKTSPQYLKVNLGMTLSEFQAIFWLEYVHRLWGRLIGVVFLVPFLVFLWRGRLGEGLMRKLVLMFVLGGAQGALGWFMVQSGLVNDPAVSQYRLTAHLGLALVIYAYILWVAHGLAFAGAKPRVGGRLATAAVFLLSAVFVTALAGALVAGLDAGLAYNTFPQMGDQWIPDGILELSPLRLNFFENVAMVQFQHRCLATATVVFAILFWAYARTAPLPARGRMAVAALPIVALVQFGLGVATVVNAVPVSLGALHQAFAVVLLTVCLLIVREMFPQPPEAGGP